MWGKRELDALAFAQDEVAEVGRRFVYILHTTCLTLTPHDDNTHFNPVPNSSSWQLKCTG